MVHPYTIEKEKEDIDEIKDQTKKQALTKARVGQGKYREQLLLQCPFRPITMVSDDRLLIASHIKPWAKSNESEKTDPFNGFMFTPTFDYLFDRGFLSFTDDKRSILSPFWHPSAPTNPIDTSIQKKTNITLPFTIKATKKEYSFRII